MENMDNQNNNLENSRLENENQHSLSSQRETEYAPHSPEKKENNGMTKGKILDQEGEQTSSILRWTFFLFLGIIALFYMVLLWSLLSGNVDNPLFQILGIESRDLKETLLNLTDILFAIGSLIFLILTLIRFFQWVVLEKDSEDRQKFIVQTSIYFLIFVSVVGLWVLFRILITNVKVDTFGIENHMVQTIPQNTIGLTAPILVEFDIATRLYEVLSRDVIQQISWDFDNDGKIDATGDKVTYRFLDKGKNNGRYPVTVSIEYVVPQTREEKRMELVREVIISNESVRANITADQESGPVPLDVQFSANGSRDPDGEIILYEWDLDNDGDFELSGDQLSVVQKRFESVGNYTVRLRVTGTTQDIDEATLDIVVGNSTQDLIAKINSDNGFEGMMPFAVTFDGALSFSRVGDIVRYEWFIEGESEPVVGRTIKRTFRRSGEYDVFLTVENDRGEKNRVMQTITVLDSQVGTQVSIKSDPPLDAESGLIRGKAPFEIEFDARSSTIRNPIEWRWDFENDGVVDDFARVARHTYRTPGEYTVRLTIVDSLDREFSTTEKVLVENFGTNAVIMATPSSGVAPLRVRLDGSASKTDSGEIIAYRWYLLDEEPFNYDAQLDYVFDTVGTYPVKLQVLTSDGKQDTETRYIVVRGTPLKSNFTYSIDNNNPLLVSFDSSDATGTIVSYAWNFGDGNASRRVDPQYEFPYPGKFNVTLKVTGPKGIISEYSQEVTVGEGQ